MPDDLTYAFGHPYFYTIPDFIADPNANAVPGTFADANANGHCNCDGDGDNNTRAVVNTHGYRNADRNRHAEAYA